MSFARLRQALAALLLLAPSVAHAQSTPVYQQGQTFAPGDLVALSRNGQVRDAGGILGDPATGLGVKPFAITDSKGVGLSVDSAATTGSYNSLTLGHDSSGNAVIGVSGGSCYFNIANIVYPCGQVVTGAALVADNAALAITGTAGYPAGVWRNRYASGSDAQPLFFGPLTGACAANGLVNDGGSCVNASDGNSWAARFPPEGIDWREFGVAATAADNQTKAQAALDAGFNLGLTVRLCGAGTFKSSTLYYYGTPLEWCSHATVLQRINPGPAMVLVDAPGHTYPQNSLKSLTLVRPTVDMNASLTSVGGAGIIVSGVFNYDIEDPVIYNIPTNVSTAPGLAVGGINAPKGSFSYTDADGPGWAVNGGLVFLGGPEGNTANGVVNNGWIGNYQWPNQTRCAPTWGAAGIVSTLPSQRMKNINSPNPYNGNTVNGTLVDCNTIGVRDDYGSANVYNNLDTTWSQLVGVALGTYGRYDVAVQGPSGVSSVLAITFASAAYGNYAITGTSHSSTTIDGISGADIAKLFAGQSISGSGIPAGDLIVSVGASSITLSTATTSGTTATFTAGSPVVKSYSGTGNGATAAAALAAAINADTHLTGMGVTAGLWPNITSPTDATMRISYGDEYSAGLNFTGDSDSSTTVSNISPADIANLTVGMLVNAKWTQPGSTISSIGATSIVLSLATTAVEHGIVFSASTPDPLMNFGFCASITSPSCTGDLTLKPYHTASWSKVAQTAMEQTSVGGIYIGANVRTYAVDNPQQCSGNPVTIVHNHAGPAGSSNPKIYFNQCASAFSYGTALPSAARPNPVALDPVNDSQPYLLAGTGTTATIGCNTESGTELRLMDGFQNGGWSASPATLAAPAAACGHFTIAGAASQSLAKNYGNVRAAFSSVNNNTLDSPGNNGSGDVIGLEPVLLGAATQASPANPAATGSAAFVMMGLGGTCKFTPAKSGRVLLSIAGTMGNDTGSDGATVKLAYGTGTAPANAAAASGTVVGPIQSSGTNTNQPFNVGGIAGMITTLTIGTPYWFDLQGARVTGGNASFAALGCSAQEIE